MTVPHTLKTWLSLGLLVGCVPHERTGELSGQGGIDVTATLDPASTPVYAGDAPMKFEFFNEMRKRAVLTLSVYSRGAHRATHIDAPMHLIATGAPIRPVPLDPLL